MNEHDDPDDFQRPNWLAGTSLALGIVTFVLQPTGCCMGMCSTLPIVLATIVAGVLGWLGMRQAMENDGDGLSLAYWGLTFAGINAAIDLVWVSINLLFGLCYGAAVLGQ